MRHHSTKKSKPSEKQEIVGDWLNVSVLKNCPCIPNQLIIRIFILVGIFLFSNLYAQDLSKATDKKSYNVGGGVSASTVFYGVDGIENRRAPFYWQVNANLNFTVAGMSIPFSASFSQQDRAFTQPFNQIGLSPQYKSVTTHIGYRSMNFSTYTLGGITFLGLGVEVKPKDYWINGGAMWGRLQRAVAVGGRDGTIIGIPAYERWGYAAKVNLGTKKNNFDFIFFHGKDDETSVPDSLSTSEFKPGENLVWAINTKQELSKRVRFNLEYAFSAYTDDVRNQDVILESFSYYNNLGPLFTPNSTTQFNKAIKTDVTYKADKYNLKLAYRRIDPNYKTMGAPFLNNDLEDISGDIAWQMHKKKINVAVAGGLQRNNLDNSQLQEVIRLISSLNINYAVSEKLNLTMGISNFNTSSSQVQFLEIDSLKYFQVTRSANFGANYRFGKKDISQALIFNSSWQGAEDSQDNGSQVINLNVGHQLGLMKIHMTIGTSFNYNNSQFGDFNNNGYGPTVSVSKKLLKQKMNQSVAFSWLNTVSDGTRISSTSNIRATTSYRLKKKHSLNLSLIYLSQNSFQEDGKKYKEYRATLQYAYQF